MCLEGDSHFIHRDAIKLLTFKLFVKVKLNMETVISRFEILFRLINNNTIS